MFKKTCFTLVVLLISSITLVACVPTADLIPSSTHSVNFCERSTDGENLLVYVKNIGSADAASSEVQVEFFVALGSTQVVNGVTVTGVLGSNDEVAVEVPIPVGCFNPDCEFTITVDPSNAVPEYNETNNTGEGSCIG